MSWGIPIIGDLIDLGKTWVQGKQKQAQAKAEAKADVMRTAATSRAEWEALQAQGAATSWKDEFFSVVLAIPAIMCFIPDQVDNVTAGFAALNTMPDYYKAFLGIAISASFGVKGYRAFRAGK